ncbi:MAG TPA: hypothetical protein VM939_14705 [Gemmatimonadaceae bacterium]|nr:hypothetical protein [Gemmatimonadaceae bacterium]
MQGRVTRTLAVLALMLLPACQAWKVDTRPVDVVVRDDPGGKVALTMQDRRWVVLKDTRLESDSIVGTRIAGNTKGTRRMSLPLAGVRTVERRRFSVLRTIGLGVALAFVPSLYRLATVEEE